MRVLPAPFLQLVFCENGLGGEGWARCLRKSMNLASGSVGEIEMAGQRRYRAGAIGRTGAGGWGHGLSLAYREIDGVDFVAVADPDGEGGRKAAAETGAERSYADYREMLEKEALDIVSVCPRWVDCHEEMVLACVEAGCHVYSEKPMAADLGSADRMVAAADRAGRKVAVAHQGVYLPQVQEVKRLLEGGRIGPVQAIYAAGKQDRRGGGEDMMVLGTHLFNMMRFFAGDVAWMSAHVTSGGREIGPEDVREAGEPIGPMAGDCVESYFAFENGVSGFYDGFEKEVLRRAAVVSDKNLRIHKIAIELTAKGLMPYKDQHPGFIIQSFIEIFLLVFIGIGLLIIILSVYFFG